MIPHRMNQRPQSTNHFQNLFFIFLLSYRSVSADVMRVLGNDFTHYERKYENIDFEVLKRYIQIFINAIDSKYLIKHPAVPVNPALTE